jgi:hypothetical protein
VLSIASKSSKEFIGDLIRARPAYHLRPRPTGPGTQRLMQTKLAQAALPAEAGICIGRTTSSSSSPWRMISTRLETRNAFAADTLLS